MITVIRYILHLFIGGTSKMHSKKLMKPLCIIALFGSILLLLSSCNFNELKRFGLGVLTGNPIKDNDIESQTIEVVDNPNNYYIKDDETSEAVFKYTIEKSYFINDLSEANLSIDDFPNSNGKTEYFTSDGKLIDNNLQLLCIELSIEKQSERKRSYTGTEDENIHILENMYLFADDYKFPINESYFCAYLEQTEDITRSSEENEYYYFSLKKDETARFKLCYIVNKTELENQNICICLGESVVLNGTDIDRKICYIPLKIERER